MTGEQHEEVRSIIYDLAMRIKKEAQTTSESDLRSLAEIVHAFAHLVEIMKLLYDPADRAHHRR